MQLTDIFIKRPVLAICINLLIFIGGYQAYSKLVVRQYPKSDLAVVTVTTAYVGASADLVRGFITTPLERVIASADGIDYLESQSSQGVSTITAHLRLNFDINSALTQIQAKVAQVRNDLPPEAEIPVIDVQTSDNRFASMYLSFYTDDMDRNQITDYLTRVVQPQLSAVPGVQRADVLGARTFAMRVWLKPDRLAAWNLTPSAVKDALAANNFLSAIGNTKGSMITVDLTTNTDLRSKEEFEQLVVHRSGDTLIRLKDISDVELGAESYDEDVRFSGQTATFMGVWVLPNANALDVIKNVRAMIPDIQSRLPSGMKAGIPYDATAYIEDAIHEVVQTLIETILIVILVIFLFLGSFRAVLVPIVAIPLSLVGAIGLMLIFGFTINLLTLLAIVLSVGLVVDDAIVMLENVERHVEEGMKPFEAAIAAARELVGPIIAMTITLATVYAPIGIQGGLTGTLFKEFAFTLAGAVLVSGVVALTLSPMMSSKLVRHSESPGRFKLFVDRNFSALQGSYERWLRLTLDNRPVVFILAAAVMLLILPLYTFSTKELAPREDQGVLFSIVQAAPNSTVDQNTMYTRLVYEAYQSFPEFSKSFQLTRPNFGFSGMITKPWSQRSRTTLELEPEAWGKMAKIPGVRLIVTSPPPLPGGSDFPVEFVISSTAEPHEVVGFANQLVAKAFQSGVFMFADTDLKFDLPQSNILFDRDKVAAMGIDMSQVGKDLGVFLGGDYVNRFNIQGRSYKVIPQAQRVDRLNPEQLLEMYVSGPNNSLVRLSTIASIENTVQPRQLNRFQQLNSAKIQGAVIPGQSIDAGLKVLEAEAAKILPSGYITDYAGESRQLRSEQNSLVTTLILAVILIFLVLAAQFESFRDPFIVLLGSVPLALGGALVFVFLGFTSLNIYSQVGLVTLVGLISKNGILIVEFANKLQEDGYTKLDAVVGAATTRLRPILMTSVATVVGHFPLVIATGAGAGSRNSIGTVLVTGMIIGTIFTLFVVPSIYLLIASTRIPADEKEMSHDPSRNGGSKKLGLGAAAAVALLAGCAVGPDYKVPDHQVAGSFSETGSVQVAQGEVDRSWWRSFNDSKLVELVAQAVEGSPSVALTVARINEARALRQDAFHNLFPTVSPKAGFTRSRDSTARIPFMGDADLTHEVYNAGADATWELDLFGRVRRGVEQARGQEEAAMATHADALRSVVAEVATNYFTLRGNQSSLLVAQKNAAAQAESVKLTEAQAQNGMISDLDVWRAKAQLNSTLAAIPPIEAAIKVSTHRLGVLVGKNPDELKASLLIPEPLPRYEGPLVLGNPADLIRRRPDVRAVERKLSAATAGIGVAEGDWFPRVSFIGSLGFESDTIANLGVEGTRAYSFGPSITWGMLGGPSRVVSRIRAADARAQAALAEYEGAVLTALEEVENALVRYGTERARRDKLKEAALQSAKAAELAQVRYKEGSTDFLTVLDAQRTEFQADGDLSQSETQLAINLVGIYKALAGEWAEESNISQ